MAKKNICSSTKKLTSIEVRDAIVDCFLEAHKEALSNVLVPDEMREKFNRNSVILIVKEAMRKAQGNYDNPTKETLFFSLFYLAELAKNFRDIDLIVKHFKEMLNLIDKLD
ncbi:MAG: hypothetical protein QXM96_00580 [Candidatus Woesearchaeota archaeon]